MHGYSLIQRRDFYLELALPGEVLVVPVRARLGGGLRNLCNYVAIDTMMIEPNFPEQSKLPRSREGGSLMPLSVANVLL